MDINTNNVTENTGGLHSDNSLQNQPKSSQRFVLNAINETEQGDEFYRSNEESNEICAALKEDFVPIGKCYKGNNETIIYSVKKDNSVSEIGILSNSCQYTVHVNDENSSSNDKLGFTVEHQIQATYRLRRGCERTTYFTDDNKKPRYYNFDKPEDFKNDNGTWAGRKFNLFKEYNKIPKFKSVQVIDSGGVIEPGSVNISIRYVDEGLNPSEWIISSPIINIYNDSQTEDFLNIRGSINSDTDYINFPATSKSIKIELDNLDDNYPFYQLAFIEATSGNGQITKIKYTDTIPTSKDYFIYTGENISTIGTEEEILFFNDIIYRANSIEQIENRLILANTEGKSVDFCKLQKYASKIKADVITKKIIVNQIQDPRNAKNPTMHFGDMITGGTGYMPGEMYSFGLVYVFSDGSLSPTYHIPGKSNDINPDTIFESGVNTYPMSNDNESENNTYIDNNNCSSDDYWGLDSEGVLLKGKPVRHHRFPLRSKLGLPLVTEESSSSQTFDYYKLSFSANGTTPLPCTQEMIDAGSCSTIVVAPPFQARVSYTVDGSPETLVMNIDTNNIPNPVNITELSALYSSNVIVVTQFEESDGAGGFYTVSSFPSPKGLTYTSNIVPSSFDIKGKVYSTEILGIKFSNVEIPNLIDTNGEQIIGYYIVRNERVENEKTILDSAVLTPSLINNKYISHGLLQPQIGDSNRLSKDIFGLIHPEHKFNNKEYTNYTSIIQEGNFDVVQRYDSKTRYNDVLDGSSYDSSIHKKGNDDGDNQDGWCLTTVNRDTHVKFTPKTSFNILEEDIKEKFYLSAVHSRDINDGANTVYNIAGDNKIGMIQLNANNLINPVTENLPYVLLKRKIADSYSNFRTLPYYKDSINMETTSTTNVFSGDTYVSPMRYTNTLFWDNRVAKRAGKTSVWNYIIGAILIVVGVVLLIFGGSGALVIGAGIAVIGGGALFLSSGIEKDALVKAYYEEYDKGLRETVLDDLIQLFYRDNISPFGIINYPYSNDGPSDDEIQWIGETVTDLWFESQINMSLRNKMTSDAPTFLDGPGLLESGNTEPLIGKEYYGLNYDLSVSRYPVSKMDNHINKKLLVYNSKRKDNRGYIGHSLGEWYQVNPDYHRINKQKIYYHLPLEYDCCSDCKENFPHRWHWSEQSFQEELTDNYRVFLPNNYKDLEGETGEITNIFKIGNNLFIHTEEALYQIPRNYQERVTDQIVSFIGTGSYGEIPAQKILDDDTGSSAGSQHKWGLIKTPNGVFFPSENQRKIYQFNGQNLKPISDIGISNWFQNNMEIKLDKQYYDAKQELYPHRNNPSNPLGSGFISTYDTTKERIIFTKKDLILNPEIFENLDFELCISNNQVTYFANFNETIHNKELDGWRYEGISNCRLQFSKTLPVVTTEVREVQVWHPEQTITTEEPSGCDYLSSAEYIFTYDASAEFNSNSITYTLCGDDTPIIQNIVLEVDEVFTVNLNNICISGTINVTGDSIITGIGDEIFGTNHDCEFNTVVTIIPGFYTTSEEIVSVTTLEKVFSYIDGVVIENAIQANNSWTISYSLKQNTWTSWHSYLPNFYINVPEKFYSWIYGNNNIWKHNRKGHYQTYYGELYPFILEYVSLSNPLTTKIWEYLTLLVEAKKFNYSLNEYVDVNDVFFNKLIAYNARQCSGLINIKVKDFNIDSEDYLYQQIENLNNNEIIVDRNERNWAINELRDIRVNYTEPIFISDLYSLQNEYYIDKVLNNNAIDYNKDWTELESFRDKYLVVRLIFDKFADTKMIMNFSVENESQSFR